ncbi:MAG: NADP-dependent oxidoreductase [Proteobacteria bacterium]|nr:NADP-dependent oxidoreductase [Pseudomonadota bacterium]
MKYKAIQLIKRPQAEITPDIFKMVTLETPELKKGQILLRQTHMSLDPAMRGWMSEDTKSYIPPVSLGEIMRSSGVAEVVESRHGDFPVGTHVIGMMGWTEYAISSGEGLQALPAGIPAEAVLAVLALPGVTAYQGLMNIGKPKAGETILISGAAGSVGSIVGQIAKAEGLHVVGTAGTGEKCRWLEHELHFDKAINYHTPNLNQEIADATPNGIDLYYENTGGPVQHAAFARMNTFGRIVVCGMISDYNTSTPEPGPNWIPIIKKRLKIQGFAMPDHWGDISELSQKVAVYLLKGQIKYRVHILDGLESAIEGINLLFTGGNKGKLMVKL